MQQPPQGPYQPGYPQQGPYQPQGHQTYYPPQPGGMQQPPPPPRPPRNRKKIAIGCGTLFLLFLIIGSCNAIISGGRGVVNTDAPSSQGDTSTVATMPPHATTASNDVQPPEPTTAPTTAPTHAVPTTVAPTPVPTQPPAPTQAPAPTSPPVHTGVNGNPWGYDFTAGNLIYSPPADFCGQYFTCVTTFWKSMNGYVAQCADGIFTHSGGVRGECSHNGGKGQILYSH